MAPLCKLVLVLDPRLSFEQEPLRETLIVGYEYGFEILKSRAPFHSSLEYKWPKKIESEARKVWNGCYNSEREHLFWATKL